MAEIKEYVGITRSKLDCLKQRFQSQGVIPPPGDSGTIEQQGIRVSMTYVEAEQKLLFGIIEKPFFIAEHLVWTLLDRAVESCAQN
jgi:hypothetical protein